MFSAPHACRFLSPWNLKMLDFLALMVLLMVWLMDVPMTWEVWFDRMPTGPKPPSK